jgi:heat shock protein HslJ
MGEHVRMPGTARLPWGTQWDLRASADPSLDADAFLVTLGFQDQRAGGRAPVNRYFGMCREDPDGRLSIGPVGMTMMAGPPQAMAAETAYLSLLEQVASFDVADDVLTLSDSTGRVLLTFVPSADPE